MTEESDRFRRVMSHFVTGVTIVTAVDPEGSPVGLTANSVASVSLEPRLFLVCMDRRSSSLSSVLESGQFGVSMLGAEHAEIARRFSEEVPGMRFKGLDLRSAGFGTPILADSLAWLECRVWRAVEAGDHTIVVGEVLDCAVGLDRDPLIFFKGEYGTVGS